MVSSVLPVERSEWKISCHLSNLPNEKLKKSTSIIGQRWMRMQDGFIGKWFTEQKFHEGKAFFIAGLAFESSLKHNMLSLSICWTNNMQISEIWLCSQAQIHVPATSSWLCVIGQRTFLGLSFLTGEMDMIKVQISEEFLRELYEIIQVMHLEHSKQINTC